jgi:predicted HAD superfamily Cof-like phosphohydrolase
VARKEHSKKSKKKIKKKISSTRPVAKSPVARAGTPIQSETEWDENDFKNTRVVQVIKNSKSSSPDFPKDFHSYHSEVQHAVYRMSDSYTMTKNRTKILLDALWTYGGFILQHKDSKKILAAAVVELEHQRTFPDDEDNDHECAIIHYHSPFNKNLRGLWHYMYKYMLRRDLVKKIKYVYYPTDPLSKLVASCSFVDYPLFPHQNRSKPVVTFSGNTTLMYKMHRVVLVVVNFWHPLDTRSCLDPNTTRVSLILLQ